MDPNALSRDATGRVRFQRVTCRAGRQGRRKHRCTRTPRQSRGMGRLVRVKMVEVSNEGRGEDMPSRDS